MRQFIALAILAILVGCSTPYQSMGLLGGVVAQPVTNDVVRISVRGNGYTAGATVQDYVLLKAAETTVQRGATHFMIVNVQNASQSTLVTTPGIIDTSVGIYTPATTNIVIKPGQDVLIRILPLTASAQEKASAIDAQQIIANIGPRVKRE